MIIFSFLLLLIKTKLTNTTSTYKFLSFDHHFLRIFSKFKRIFYSSFCFRNVAKNLNLSFHEVKDDEHIVKSCEKTKTIFKNQKQKRKKLSNEIEMIMKWELDFELPKVPIWLVNGNSKVSNFLSKLLWALTTLYCAQCMSPTTKSPFSKSEFPEAITSPTP